MNKLIKSPLRYPGGKSRALPILLPKIPIFEEFREPFVGGGSVFLAVKQLYPSKKYWINDINNDLYLFWKIAKNSLHSLVMNIKEYKKNEKDGRKLFIKMKNLNSFDELDRALRFFILNRITFSGTIDSGGYSQKAFESRFTDSSIERLLKLEGLLNNVLITNEDFEYSILKPGKNVFVFLDPPYFSATKSKLYGKNGDLHTGFDHKRFSNTMKKCKHKWLITYDDSEEIRRLFKFANIIEWQLQYGMNNYKKTIAKKGNELLISNYNLELISRSQNVHAPLVLPFE